MLPHKLRQAFFLWLLLLKSNTLVSFVSAYVFLRKFFTQRQKNLSASILSLEPFICPAVACHADTAAQLLCDAKAFAAATISRLCFIRTRRR
jgi:hypothetical protein